MYDTVEKIGYSTIHHGPYNNRIYLMTYNEKDEPYIANWLELLAANREYGKIIAKLPQDALKYFIKNGFKREGKIPGYYRGKETCYFFSKYFTYDREEVRDKAHIEEVLMTAQSKSASKQELELLNPEFHIRQMTLNDASNMAKIYQSVFETYPFPICDEEYIKETMRTHVRYFGVEYKDELVGLASCEMNHEEENVEMTDFAILPKARGHKLAKYLLLEMEKAMRKVQIKTFYTIARAASYPMNAAFSSMGYVYGGTLYNNTQIAGNIESMNIWYKNNI